MLNGTNINQLTIANHNALAWAVNKRQLEMVKFLVQHGINIQQISDQGSALHIARRKEFHEIAAYLAGVGAKDIAD